MAANAISGILLVIGLFYLISSSISLVVIGDGKAVFQILLGMLLIIIAAAIRFRHRLNSVAEKRIRSATEFKNQPKE